MPAHHVYRLFLFINLFLFCPSYAENEKKNIIVAIGMRSLLSVLVVFESSFPQVMAWAPNRSESLIACTRLFTPNLQVRQAQLVEFGENGQLYFQKMPFSFSAKTDSFGGEVTDSGIVFFYKTLSCPDGNHLPKLLLLPQSRLDQRRETVFLGWDQTAVNANKILLRLIIAYTRPFSAIHEPFLRFLRAWAWQLVW